MGLEKARPRGYGVAALHWGCTAFNLHRLECVP